MDVDELVQGWTLLTANVSRVNDPYFAARASFVDAAERVCAIARDLGHSLARTVPASQASAAPRLDTGQRSWHPLRPEVIVRILPSGARRS
jgi:hypothetical protein